MSDDFFDGLDRAVETLRLGTSAERAAALLQLSREIVSSLDAREALLGVGEAMRQLVEGERFLVIDQELRVTSARDSDGRDLPTPLTHCHELVRAAAQSEALQFVPLPLENERWGALESVKHLRLVGMAAVPLVGAQGLCGAIYVDAQNSFARKLDAAATEVITLLAQHAAQAVENAALMAQVAKDPASDSMNAAYFERRLHEEMRRSTRYMSPFSLMFVEIEGAAEWIARYGSSGVDEIVRDIVAALREECRRSDVVARVGPARLGLLLPEMNVQGATAAERFNPKQLSARLRQRLDQRAFRIADIPQQVKLSIGAVTYQEAPVVGLKGVLHEAELAVDVARREGADRFLVR